MTTSTYSLQNNSESPLLNLPTEIRLQIWSYALTYHEPICPIHDISKGYVEFENNTPERTADWSCHENVQIHTHAQAPIKTARDLPRTCRAIYNDVIGESLFYKINSFKFICPKHLLGYLAGIDSKHRAAIQTITIGYCCSIEKPLPMDLAMKSLSHCPGLRNPTIDITLCPKILIDEPDFYKLEKQFPGLDELWDLRGLQDVKLYYSTEPFGTMNTVSIRTYDHPYAPRVLVPMNLPFIIVNMCGIRGFNFVDLYKPITPEELEAAEAPIRETNAELLRDVSRPRIVAPDPQAVWEMGAPYLYLPHWYGQDKREREWAEKDHQQVVAEEAEKQQKKVLEDLGRVDKQAGNDQQQVVEELREGNEVEQDQQQIIEDRKEIAKPRKKFRLRRWLPWKKQTGKSSKSI